MFRSLRAAAAVPQAPQAAAENPATVVNNPPAARPTKRERPDYAESESDAEYLVSESGDSSDGDMRRARRVRPRYASSESDDGEGYVAKKKGKGSHACSFKVEGGGVCGKRFSRNVGCLLGFDRSVSSRR